MDKGNSFFFSHWNLALTFLTFVFRIDMHTHFAAPQKRGYTHTLGLAPLPREPIDTSISNMGFLCTSTWWQLCYGETSSPGKLDWIGRGIWWRPWWIYTLPNVRPGFRTPPKKKNPNLTGLPASFDSLLQKSRVFWRGKYFLAIFWRKKLWVWFPRGLQVLQWQLLEISHHFFSTQPRAADVWNFTTDFWPRQNEQIRHLVFVGKLTGL